MSRVKKQKILQHTVLASLLTALITVLTFYVKIPAHNGYIHLGDAVIYLAATLLPAPLAMVCSGLGGMFADLFGGYTLYIIPTLIIKMLLVLPFSCKGERIMTTRNIAALPICVLITTLGYYVAEVILISVASISDTSEIFRYLLSPAPWTAALYTIPGNIIQSIGSILIFIPSAIALDKTNIKGKI
ncbi:MAG: TIGR04002 family protein [Clostridia bacterium]|nr:TIGR04002 family protein [Clostridia bacterium]